MEAFTGIFQGFASSKNLSVLVPFVQPIGDFLACLAADMQTRNEAVTTGCVGLIGDIAAVLGKQAMVIVSRDYVYQLLSECTQSSSENAQNVGQWVQEIVQKTRQA